MRFRSHVEQAFAVITSGSPACQHVTKKGQFLRRKEGLVINIKRLFMTGMDQKNFWILVKFIVCPFDRRHANSFDWVWYLRFNHDVRRFSFYNLQHYHLRPINIQLCHLESATYESTMSLWNLNQIICHVLNKPSKFRKFQEKIMVHQCKPDTSIILIECIY